MILFISVFGPLYCKFTAYHAHIFRDRCPRYNSSIGIPSAHPFDRGGREVFQMFSNKTANNRVLAVAFVSMLVLCSFGVVLTEESDAAYDEQFDIYMRTTDVFSYAPAVNLTDEGTTDIVATGDAYTGGHLGWMNGASEAEDWAEGYTISGSFATSGDYQLVLTATWTDGTLTQSAKQTINFHVYDFIVLSSNSGENTKGYTIDDLAAADIVIDTVQAGSEKYPEALTYSAQIAFEGVDGAGTNSLLT